MIATYLNSLHEAFAKRTAMVLIGLALLLAFAFNHTADDVIPAVAKGQKEQTAHYIQLAVARQLVAASAIWILVSIFAAAPLFSSSLEKGWLELMFAKGTPRWQIFLARILAGTTLYVMTFALANFPLAIHFWWTAGVPPWRIGVAELFETLALVSLLAIAALSSLLQRGPGLPILLGASGWFVSFALQARKEIFYGLFKSYFPRWIVDWAYRILPKCAELHDMATFYIREGKVLAWWPVWTTAVFTVCTLCWTMWRLERKSF